MALLGSKVATMYKMELVWFGLVTTAGYDPKTLLEIVIFTFRTANSLHSGAMQFHKFGHIFFLAVQKSSIGDLVTD